MSRFVNTQYFRESILHYEKHGKYTLAPTNSKDYWDFWEEEKRRILNGYEVGGVRITGYHYWYLNYCRIKKVANESDATGEAPKRGGSSKIWGSPEFWDGDYNYFWAVEIARHGISKEEYDALNLDIEINEEDLRGGRHLVVLKARRKGYSYKSGSMMAKHYYFGRKDKCYAMAGLEEFLIGDGLITKTFDNIDFVDSATPFRQPKLTDTKMHRISGYVKNEAGIYVKAGRQNEIIGVSLRDDPDKARGKDGVLGFFEEAGKLPGLLKAWEVCRPSYEQGNVTTGIMIAFGTGGTEGADYEGLEQLFGNPEANRCLAIENQWDDGAKGTWGGFFIPASQNLEGFMDSDGNSDQEDAKTFLNRERDLKKQSKDSKALEQYICEQPLTPREATLQTTNNIFPTALLVEQQNRVEVGKLWTMHPSGLLFKDKAGDVKFRPDESRKPIYNYPHRKDQDLRGAVVIKEAPVRIGGKVPRGLYVICVDPYDHDGNTTSSSLGSAYVLKMTNNITHTYNDCIVAEYVGRPETQDEFNEQLFLLAEYYGCKIGFENDRGNLIEYAKRKKLLNLLEEEFQMLHKKELQSARTSRPFGMHMTESRKNQGEIYLRDWMMTPISVSTNADTGEKEHRLILHTIHDPALLTELIKYNKKGNFDRVMSLMVGMYYLKEMYHAKVVPRTEASPFNDFFQRPLFT